MKGSFFIGLIAAVLAIQSSIVTSATITFGTSANIATTFNGDKQFTVIDLDGDTDLDVVSGSGDDNEISWFENNGSESFTERSVQTSYDVRLSDVADIDGDGNNDIVAAGFTEDEIAWWQSDGTPADGGWTKRTIGGTLNGAYGVDIIDVDGDGDLDVFATAYLADDVVWYENDGTPLDDGWTKNNINVNSDGAAHIIGSDIDGDGDIDVIAGGNAANSIAVFENDGAVNPSFTAHVLDSSATGVIGLDVADIDGDGELDIVAALSGANTLKWYKNDGTISAENWTGYNIDSTVSAVYDVDAGDFDGDGDVDVLGSARGADDIEWYENDGSVTADDDWTATNVSSAASTPNGVEMLDLDEDGDLDAIAAHASGISWLSNDNIAPELVSASITNLDDTDNLYAGLRTYNFQTVVSDANGTSDISTVRVRFTQTIAGPPLQATTTVFLYNKTTNTFSWESGSTAFTVTGGNATTTGNQLTVTWNVTFGWGGIEQDDINLQARVTDANGAQAGYTTLQPAYFDTKTTLAVNTTVGSNPVWAFTDSTLNPDVNNGSISYYLAYAGSALQPPDAQITSVNALRDDPSADVDETVTAGTTNDGTITVSTSSTLGAHTYSPKIILSDSSIQTFDSTNATVTTDRVRISDITVSNHLFQETAGRYWDDHNGSGDAMTVTVTAALENAGTLLSGEMVTIGYEGDTDAYGASGAFSSGTATLSVEENPATGAVTTRDNIAVASVTQGTVNVYGTTPNLNSQNDQDIGWDNANPTITDRLVSESSSFAYYNTSTAVFYFSSLMPDTVDMVLTGTGADTGSGLQGIRFSEEPSLSTTTPADDTTMPAGSGTYLIRSASTATDSPAQITVYDNVNNSKSYSVSYVLDELEPTGYETNASSDPYIDIEEATVSVSGAVDNASGVGVTNLEILETNTGVPAVAQSSVPLAGLADGTYYAATYATDNVGNAGAIVYDEVVIDAVNVAPSAPTAGFVPSEDMRLASQTPTLSWTAATDTDPYDTAARLHYVVRLDDDGEVINNHDDELTTTDGTVSVALTEALTDDSTWVYAVKTVDERGLASAFSRPISFSVDTSLNTDVVATKTVGINVGSGSVTMIDLNEIPFWARWLMNIAYAEDGSGEEIQNTTEFPRVFGSMFIVKKNTWIISVLNAMSHPVVNYTILTLFLLALGYSFGALRQKKPVRVPEFKQMWKSTRREARHIWKFLMKAPADSFHDVAPRDDGGTWIYSFSTYQAHHRFSRATAGIAVAVVTAKIFIVLVISIFLITQAHRVVGESPYLDDGATARPYDTLTYRVSFVNNGPAAATSVVLWDNVPDNTSLVPGSVLLNDQVLTEASDADALTLDGNLLRFSLNTIAADEDVDVTYTVRVNEPLSSTTVTNDAVIAWAEKKEGIRTNITENPISPGSVSGRVWNDLDSDGNQDNGESGLKSVVVRLYRDTNANAGLDINTDTLIASATTAADGTYKVTGLGSGTFFAHVLGSSVPSGYTITTEPSTLRLTLSAGENYQAAHFGYVGSVAAPAEETPSAEVATGDELVITVEPTTQEDISDELLKDFKLVTVGPPEKRTVVSGKRKVEIRTKEDVLVFSGFARPFAFVTITIFSDPLVFTTQADGGGKWEVHVATELLDVGEHRVLAEVSDEGGRSSEQIEIAKIVVEKELTTVNIIVYIVLVAVIIILTVLVALLIMRRDIGGDAPPPKKSPSTP